MDQQPREDGMSRRGFFQRSAVTGGALAMFGTQPRDGAPRPDEADHVAPLQPLPDLRPARWIWYPSGRCLQSTFVLFRRQVRLPARPKRARGWILGDSRYLLRVNGTRIQWGPAPADPRFPEVDPVDLTAALSQGVNVIGAQVLFYGQGDGTWPLGKPGFLFWLEIECDDGSVRRIVSDGTWRAHMARSSPPGHFKRWYLRALQEQFDARRYPYGWADTHFKPDDTWLPAMVLDCPVDKPSLCSTYREYQLEIRGDRRHTALRARSIPLLAERRVGGAKLAESCWIHWRRPPEEWFECLTPNAFSADRRPSARADGADRWRVTLDGQRAAALTFELAEQVVGWPMFTVEAPAGTVVELMVHEGHQVGGPALLNSHFDSWSRFICKEGVNRFEPFDYESCRWLQLHIHGARGEVTVSGIGMRRRMFPWPHTPRVACSEPPLQRLIDASINTLHNSAQDIVVDGMARERQQYSGDCGHQLHAVYLMFGETRLPARFLNTFSQGMTVDGYFLDCWPAYDRLARLMERQLQLTKWGPILDHGIGFNFDCWHHYLYTGALAALRGPFPRLQRFAAYLQSIQRDDGLLPVENLGIPSVWIDHVAYRRQRHKQCALNLYAAAMLRHALAPIATAFGDMATAHHARTFARELLAATVRRFWSGDRGLFVNNLPWLTEEKEVRLCDRSLATSILFDQCPDGRVAPAATALAECPRELGLSYPANAGWRLWALAKVGRADVILNDLRQRWATMASVRLNNTIQEDWSIEPDGSGQWSHCGVVPLYILPMSIAGIRPLEPGFTRCEIRPQLADLEGLDLTVRTMRGPIRFQAHGPLGDRTLRVAVPARCQAELVVRSEEGLRLPRIMASAPAGHVRHRLPPGQSTVVRLRRS